MPTLRQYLEQKYGAPAGYAPLPQTPLQPDNSKQIDPLPLTSSFIPAASNPESSPHLPSPPAACSDESDTEVEDNTEVEEYYLTKSHGRHADVGTIFGQGIRVWRSHRGTAYTHIEGELLNGEVVMPRKRKRVQRSIAASVQEHVGVVNERVMLSKNLCPSGKTADILAPTRNMVNQHAHGPRVFNPRSPSTAHTRARRLVSGSFGTFEEERDRFSARPYRLLQTQPKSRCEEGKTEEEKEMRLDEGRESEDVHRGKRRWLHKLGGGVR